jgi:hypothetical protein
MVTAPPLQVNTINTHIYRQLTITFSNNGPTHHIVFIMPYGMPHFTLIKVYLKYVYQIWVDFYSHSNA